MKQLDRYIIAGFLQGYIMAAAVLVGLRIVIDLFVNLDEFSRKADLGGLVVARQILGFYALNSTVYFRDFAGMILVVAAAFCVARMVRSNELTALMASGISIRRVMVPVLLVGVLLTGLLVLDQEVVIPGLADRLARGRDMIPGQEAYTARFIPAQDGSLIFSRHFDLADGSFDRPVIICRRPSGDGGLWVVTGCIVADKATYNQQRRSWELVNGRFISRDPNQPIQPIDRCDSMGLLPWHVPILAKSDLKPLLSWGQLNTLVGLRPRDMTLLVSQKHFRVTEPIIDLIMLLIGLSVLMCRDPRYVKTAVLRCLALTGLCHILTFLAKVLSVEPWLFGRPIPQLWAWLPVIVFLPVGLVALDSVQT
ncbi:MAG: LptF/LptG family permease [Sedimentisphaerales bacterium]|nr:LptF/LptG family permease [Sedimentisphaerales bacterium]